VSIPGRLREWARSLKRDSVMLWFAMRHPDVPLLAKAVCAMAVGYALSPIDLIPDFIPVLGYLDDVILVPALIWLAIRLLPGTVIHAARSDAEVWLEAHADRPKSYLGAAAVVSIWVGCIVAVWWWLA
jgi:uncharacterized membrane protein YkvA (DUF1232 family)